MTTLSTIEKEIRLGRLDEAGKSIVSAEKSGLDNSDVRYLQAYVQEVSSNRKEAMNGYENILQDRPDHGRAAFRAAVLAEQYGDETVALQLLEKCAAGDRAPVNALVNLAVLYEDCGRLEEAEACLNSVLAEYPNHFRARHYLKSVQSSYNMAYDEKTQRERDQRSAVLDVPVTDFELSVRSRNCLRQMNIRTLGDLLRISEAELLSYKNFGETSLTEIKTMLAQKGLKLGQALQPQPEPVSSEAPERSVADGSTHLLRSVSELELSVRSRKCLQRLGITTFGELIERSESELMTIKNFGQTSLNEIRRQLATFGLSLRQGP